LVKETANLVNEMTNLTKEVSDLVKEITDLTNSLKEKVAVLYKRRNLSAATIQFLPAIRSRTWLIKNSSVSSERRSRFISIQPTI
jgi:hypothetical protein